jgi:hypothetical protein
MAVSPGTAIDLFHSPASKYISAPASSRSRAGILKKTQSTFTLPDARADHVTDKDPSTLLYELNSVQHDWQLKDSGHAPYRQCDNVRDSGHSPYNQRDNVKDGGYAPYRQCDNVKDSVHCSRVKASVQLGSSSGVWRVLHNIIDKL